MKTATPVRLATTTLSCALLALLLITACSPSSEGNNATDGGVDGGDALINNSNNQNNTVQDAGPDTIDADADGGVVVSDPRLVSGLAVSSVTAFQSVAIPLVSDGAPVSSRNAPIIASKNCTFTIHVSPDGSFPPRDITARLIVQTGGDTPTIHEATANVAGPMDPSTPLTAFRIDVPAQRIDTQTTYRLQLVDTTSDPIPDGTPHEGRFPQDGSALALGAESDDGGITIVLVPIIYNIDGSGRLPDTSQTQLDIITDLLEGTYPAATFNISLHTPVDWPQPGYENNSFDFGDMNSFLRDLKSDDNAGQEVYYYAMVRPDETFSDYCSGTCTTGQSFKVTNPESGSYRVGTGVGFSGERWAWTLLHELGHMHGRGHARCGTWSGIDWSYPYSDASIGVWGFDGSATPFLDPDSTVDFMSYCDDRWISDYHYELIFERVLTVNGITKKKRRGAFHRVFSIAGDGRWREHTPTFAPPVGEVRGTYYFYDSKGTLLATSPGWGIRQSHTSEISWAIPGVAPGAHYVEVVSGAKGTSHFVSLK